MRIVSTIARNIRLTFSPSARRQLAAIPLQQKLTAKGINHEVLADQALRIGQAAPLTAVRTIKDFLRTNKVSQNKRKSLAGTIRSLRITGWLRKLNIFMVLGAAAFCGISIYQRVTYEPPEYITIASGGKKHKIYRQNDWFYDLLKKCPRHFNDDLHMSELALDLCFREQYGMSLQESGFQVYLQTLSWGTFVNDSTMDEINDEIALSLDNIEEPQLQAVSTASKDEEVSYSSESDGKDRIIYAPYYGEIYGTTKKIIPPALQGVDKIFTTRLLAMTGTVPAEINPISYRIIDTAPNPDDKAPIIYIPIDFNKPFLLRPVNSLIEAAAVAKSFNAEIVYAANILHKHHSQDLTLEHFITMLYMKLMVELMNFRHEDPWQDIGACQWSGCKYAEAFKKAFAGVDYGIKVGDIFTQPSWYLASMVHTPMEQQGFGMYQVIFGLFQEASENPTIRSHWQKDLTPEDFKNKKAMMRAIYEKPTLCYAFVADYILTELERTIFKDPRIRVTPTIPPFIIDKTEGRQLSIMSTLFLLSIYPEKEADTIGSALYGEYTFTYAEMIRLALGKDFLFTSIPHNMLQHSYQDGTTVLTILGTPGLTN